MKKESCQTRSQEAEIVAKMDFKTYREESRETAVYPSLQPNLALILKR